MGGRFDGRLEVVGGKHFLMENVGGLIVPCLLKNYAGVMIAFFLPQILRFHVLSLIYLILGSTNLDANIGYS